MAKSSKNKTIRIVRIVIAIIVITFGLLVYFGFGPAENINDYIQDFFNSDTAETNIVSDGINEFSGNEVLVGELGEAKLKVHMIDVGQGDCIFIEFPDGLTMIIDGGDSGNDGLGRSIEDSIESYLNNLGVTTINYLMLTHTDADHVGSLDKIVEEYNIETFFVPDLIASDGMTDEANVPQSISTIQYRQFVELMNAEPDSTIIYNIGVITIKGGLDTVGDTADDYIFTMYCPEAGFYDDFTNANGSASSVGSASEDKNNQSPICVLEYQNRIILLAGDADEVAEERFVTYLQNDVIDDNYDEDTFDVDILKVGHHGSAGSSNEFLLDIIQPEYALISCGTGNSHEHPRQEALDRLVDNGVEYIFRTDLASNILVEVDVDGNMRFVAGISFSSEDSIVGADMLQESA